jgi:hypothetical protein
MEELEYTTDVTFNHSDYVVVLSAFRVSTFDSSFRLMIDVENKMTCELWRGDF